MSNQAMLDFHNIDLNQYTGKGYSGLIVDGFNIIDKNGEPRKHGQMSLALGRLLQKDMRFFTEEVMGQTAESILDKMIYHVDHNNVKFINCSWHGYRLDSIKLKDKYNYLASKAFIGASIGNSGTREKLYPGAGTKCLGTVAGGLNKGKPSRKKFSTINQRVDVLALTPWELTVDGDKMTYNATSAGTNVSVWGGVARLFQWHKEQYGVEPTVNQINAYLENFAYDMESEGEDDLTGMGCFRLFDFDDHWSVPHREYLKDKGMFIKRPFNVLSSRGDVILVIGQVSGYKGINPDKCADFLNEKGIPVKGVNSKGDYATDRIVTRAELFVMLARIKAKELGDKLLFNWEELGATAYYMAHINYLRNHGVIVNDDNLYKDGKLREMTFDSVCAMVARLIGYKEQSDRD